MPDKDPPEVSFGEELKRSRVIREVSLESIAAATKISVRHLEALERGDVSRLPAPVFTRGFIRAYAGFLGLDSEEMVNAYLAEIGGGSGRGGASTPAGPAARGPSVRFIVLGIVAAAIAVLIGAGVWRSSRQPRTTAPRSVSLPPVSLSPHIRQVAPRPVAPAPNSTSRSAPVSPVAAPASSAPALLSEAEAKGALTLGLDVNGDCWVEVFGDERSLFSGMLHAGDARRFSARKSFRLTVGNAGRVRVSVNGRDLPPLGKPGEVVREVRLDAARINEILSRRG